MLHHFKVISRSGKWEVSNVRDMRLMFERARLFNSDISKWDVSSVTPHVLECGIIRSGALRVCLGANEGDKKFDVRRLQGIAR